MKNDSVVERPSFSVMNSSSQQHGGLSTRSSLLLFDTNRRSLCKGKPPKKPSFKGNTSTTSGSRRDYQGYSEAASSFADCSTSTLSRQRTQPKPFNLSRSNSRRSKEVLFQEKAKREKEEEEEILKMQVS